MPRIIENKSYNNIREYYLLNNSYKENMESYSKSISANRQNIMRI